MRCQVEINGQLLDEINDALDTRQHKALRISPFYGRFAKPLAQTSGSLMPNTFAECTACLAGLEKLANTAISQIRHDITFARGAFSYYQPQANHLLAQRRGYIAQKLAELAGLAERKASPEERKPVHEDFIQTVVCPLLCRAWLSTIVYQYNGVVAAHTAPVFDPSICGDVAPLVAALEAGREEAPLDKLLAHMQEQEPTTTNSDEAKSRWHNARHYLQAAQAVHRAYYKGVAVTPVSVPVLVAPGDGCDWPLGYIVDALIVPRTAFDQGAMPHKDMVEQSLKLAWHAAQGILLYKGGLKLGTLALEDACLAIADYPGGGLPFGDISGDSAGLALAVGIMAHFTRQTYLPNHFATATINAEGEVGKVGSIPEKGRALALLPTRAGNTPVVAVAECNATELEEAAAAMRKSVKAEAVSTLTAAINLILSDEIYKELRQRQGEQGKEALQTLGLSSDSI